MSNNDSPPNNTEHGADSSPLSRQGLLDALNLLLEAERAGTRVAIFTDKQVQSGDLKKFLAMLKHDEAHWCDMLTRHIEKRNGTASMQCGDFFDKSIAIDDVRERLEFLNRGQAWVVRKLDVLLSSTTDAELRADLQMMRDNHVANIAETTRILDAS